MTDPTPEFPWSDLVESEDGTRLTAPKTGRYVPMDRWQRWSRTQDHRSPVTGLEMANAPCVVDLAPTTEYVDDQIRVYHAQMVACGECRQLLDPGEACDHLAFVSGPPSRITALGSGIRQIVWRSWSPCLPSVIG